MHALGVIGNVSRDVTRYPDGRQYMLLGGGALHVARAAAGRELKVAPIAVIGTDLAQMKTDIRLAQLDMSSVRILQGVSCKFDIRYDSDNNLSEIDCDYGVSTYLTDHALAVVGRHDFYHVCCRMPLDAEQVLTALSGRPFSVDFFVSSASTVIEKAAPLLPLSTLVAVNAAEFDVLRSSIDIRKLAYVMVSNGARAVRLYNRGEVVATVTPESTTAIEVTGAGDTLTGAMLGSMIRGAAVRDALGKAVEVARRSVMTAGLELSNWE